MTPGAPRPWPAPRRRPAMAMVWRDLAFLHWPIDPAQLRDQIPPELEIDTMAGDAWIGVVPFRMTGVRPWGWPGIPWLSDFPELNVRTYVRRDGKPGVWFFSLDAHQPLAVRVARWRFHLPYFDARMEVGNSAGEIHYRSLRTHRGAPPAEFDAVYASTSDSIANGEPERWLTERYCLYAADGRGQVYRGEVDHEPWCLHPAAMDLRRNTAVRAAGLEAADTEPLVHVAEALRVRAWSIEPV